jgi:hypothetical protein
VVTTTTQPVTQTVEDEETPEGAAVVSRFIDITGHWAEHVINALAIRGYVHGFPDNTYLPNDSTTRAQFVAILSNIFATGTNELTPTGGFSFTDVPATAWYAGSLAWAAQKSLVVGYSATEFAPDEDINREQLAVLIVRFAKAFNIPLTDAAERITFADGDTISPYAVESVYTARANGLVVGKPGNLYDPKGKSTRAEVAAVIYRLLEKGQYLANAPKPASTL